MENHPAASLFPLMVDDEYRALMDDIRLNGQREPIIVAEGKVLDGRNRLRACEELGIAPLTRQWQPTRDGLAIDYVVSMNLHRRHLTASQRAAVAYNLLPWYESEAKKRQIAAQNNEAGRAVREIIPELVEGRATEHAARKVAY